MNRETVKELARRALELGRSADGARLAELIGLFGQDSIEVRRLAASAIGKLAGLCDAGEAVRALIPVLRDKHPQVRQYAIKALKAYGTAAEPALHDLRDIAASTSVKEYLVRDATVAIAVIEEALRMAKEATPHHCQRCGIAIAPDEFARSQKAFQRDLCDKCFDETFLKRRNFETKVELQKTIEARDGTSVQSDGERLIADFLAASGIVYRYDERFRILDGYAIRPDFYLPEYDVYIEYWGMDTADYKIGMLKKQQLYQQQGKRLISIYPKDKSRLAELLTQKLVRFASAEGSTHGG